MVKKIKLNKQKGISIIYVVLITSIIFTIALGVNSISYQQAKSMSEIGFSTVAFFAADAGAERQLYNLLKEFVITEEILFTFDSFVPASTFTSARCSQVLYDSDPPSCMGITPDPDCFANNICVSSVGDYKGIRRAIDLKY